jgi:hypothetical protein
MVFMYSTRYSSGILNKLEFSGLVFEKYSNIKLHENASSVSRVVRRTDADMTKLTVAFRNFTILPKEECPLNTRLTFHKISNKQSPSWEGNRFYYIIWPLITLTHCRPGDEGSRFLQNVDIRLQVYTMSQPRIPQPQYYLLFRTSPPSCVTF